MEVDGDAELKSLEIKLGKTKQNQLTCNLWFRKDIL
jgi:hypothetical protein